MGLFNSLRKILPRRTQSDPKLRWEFLSDGTCVDNLREHESAWRVGVARFESLLQGLEKRTENSLGRRLAHAALEHDERIMRMGTLSKPSGSSRSMVGLHLRLGVKRLGQISITRRRAGHQNTS